MNDEWLSVKEFSERAGVTSQAIYKQLPTKLQTYIKQVGNRKYIHVSALKEFEPTKTNQYATNFQPTSNQPGTMETVNKTIEIFQKQLDIKDKQIQDLNDRLEQALKNASQSNFIAAQEKENRKMIDEPVEEKKSFFKRLFSR